MQRIQVIRLGLLVIFVSILSIRRDGYFPFAADIDPKIWAWLLVGQVAGLLILLYLFFRPQLLVKFSRRIAIPRKAISITLLTIPAVLAVASIGLLLSSTSAFPDYYHFTRPQAVVFAAAALVLLIVPLLLRNAKLALAGLFTATLLLMLIPILYFQLTAHTADLMPIILKQLEAFTHGENIYQHFLLENGVLTQAVRQPGTTLSFLPAFLLGLDIRWMSVIYSLLTGVILLKFNYPDFRKLKFDRKFMFTYTVLALFLLFPYRIVRHDLYEPIYWLLISLSLYFLYAKRLRWFAIVWALGIFTQVWFWLFTPFVAVYLWRRFDLKTSLKTMLPAILLGGILLAVFVLRDTAAYLDNVFGFYSGEIAKSAYAPSTIHLTPLVEVYGFAKLLTPIQFLATAVVGLFALVKLKTWRQLVMLISLAFFVFVQFNSVSWNYMYIGLVVIMSCFLLAESRDAVI